MFIMEKVRKRKLDSELLSNSYREGIGRVVGVNAHVTCEIPPETIKQRQIFWDDLFLKYSEQFPDDEYNLKTLKLCSSKCESTAVDEHITFVQYWVNTGYLPYQMSIHKIGHLEKDHVSMERGLNMSYTKAHCNENSLSSSVDTAAYILSNINTTNKADTMAIVEGAKHDNLENVVDTTHCESTEVSMIADDVMHDNNGDKDTRDNSNSNSCQDSLVTTEITCTTPQESIDTQGDVDMLDKALNTKSPSTDNCESYSYKLPNIVSTPEHSKESYLRKSLLDSSAIKIRHRKKLYRGRDSPVDLITMERNHKEVLCKLTNHIHPALNFKYPLQKKRNIRKRINFKRWMVNKSSMNITLSASDSKKSDEIESIKNYSNRLSLKLRDLKKLDDAPCTNHEILSNSNNIQDLNKCNKNQSINVSPPSQSVSENHEEDSQNNELNDTIIQSEKINTIASDTLSNFKQSTNSNSVIQTVDSQKHKKKSDKIMNDSKILNPVIALPRLSDLDIQKYKKLKNHSHNLHPVVCLKPLSESEIQKYKRLANTMKDAKYLNAIVRLKRLSQVAAKRYKTALKMKTRSKTDLLFDTVKKSQLSLRNKANTKTRSKSDLLPETVKLSDSNMNKSQFSLRNKANTKTRSKSDVLPETVKLSDSNMNKSQFSLRNKANTKTRSKSDVLPETVKLSDSNMNKSQFSLRNKANTKTRSKSDVLPETIKLSDSNMNKSQFSLSNKANTKTRSKSDLLPKTVKLSDSNMNKSQFSLRNKANTKTRSKSDVLPETVKLSDSNMNKSQFSLRNKANTKTRSKSDVLPETVKLSDSNMNKSQFSLSNKANTKTRSKSDLLPKTVKLSDRNMNKSQFSLRNKANTKTRSKSDLLPETVKLSDSNMNKSQFSLRNKANTKTRSKSDVLPETVKLSDSNMNKSQFSLRNKANTKTRSKSDLLPKTVKLSDSNMNKSRFSLKNKTNTKTRSKTDLLPKTVKLSDSNMNKSRFSLRNKTNMKTRSKTDLLSDTVKLSDSSMNKPQLSLKNEADGLKPPLNIINVENGDTDSNEGTILIYKCSSKVSDDISISNVLGPPKMLAEFSSPVVKTCRNSSRLKLSEIKKNFTLRKDTTNRQSIDNALNTSINSQKHIFNTSSSCESETFKNGYSDNVHTIVDKKMKLHLDSLVNPERRLRNREKFNVTKEQNGNGRNNLIERGICNTIGKRKSEEEAAVKNLMEASYNAKTKKRILEEGD